MECYIHALVALTPGKTSFLSLQTDGWAQMPVWTATENLAPKGARAPDRPIRSELLYGLSCPDPAVLYICAEKETFCNTYSAIVGL